jgi:hypothetical protein
MDWNSPEVALALVGVSATAGAILLEKQRKLLAAVAIASAGAALLIPLGPTLRRWPFESSVAFCVACLGVLALYQRRDYHHRLLEERRCRESERVWERARASNVAAIVGEYNRLAQSGGKQRELCFLTDKTMISNRYPNVKS